MTRSHDPKCHELAEHFLADVPNVTEAQKDELAQEIQTTIEDWLAYQAGLTNAAIAKQSRG
jgi:hypothetical protein